jgi:hypothetical protein
MKLISSKRLNHVNEKSNSKLKGMLWALQYYGWFLQLLYILLTIKEKCKDCIKRNVRIGCNKVLWCPYVGYPAFNVSFLRCFHFAQDFINYFVGKQQLHLWLMWEILFNCHPRECGWKLVLNFFFFTRIDPKSILFFYNNYMDITDY